MAPSSSLDSPVFAALLDQEDPLARQIPPTSCLFFTLPRFRERFEFPTLGSLPCQTEGPPNSPVVYMCGNSLGLKPKQADEYMREQLGTNQPISKHGPVTNPCHSESWGQRAVFMHFTGRIPAALAVNTILTIFISPFFSNGQ